MKTRKLETRKLETRKLKFRVSSYYSILLLESRVVNYSTFDSTTYKYREKYYIKYVLYLLTYEY